MPRRRSRVSKARVAFISVVQLCGLINQASEKFDIIEIEIELNSNYIIIIVTPKVLILASCDSYVSTA